MRALLLLLAFASSVAAEIPLAERRSGYADMGRETRAMQDDEVTGPAALWLLDGEALWNRKPGADGRACADCHAAGLKGVAARYPAVSASGKLQNLEQRINECRVERQKAPAFPGESRDLLALSAWVGRQSRGLPVADPLNERTRPHWEAGRRTFHQRLGQLNLSCAQCHDERWGRSLAGTVIPQGQATGYPIYRLEWQTMGSLQRRLRNCMTGVRAEPYAWGAREAVELELYLAWRARGLPLETPAVRP